jgi:hypothetical protein
MLLYRRMIEHREKGTFVWRQGDQFRILIRSLAAVLLGATLLIAQPNGLKSADEVRSRLSSACPTSDRNCITAECDRLWTDPESALWIITHLAADSDPFVDGYFKRRYVRERNGDVRIGLLGRLLLRNKVANLPFIVARLREVSRLGKEGDRPGLMALRYLQNNILLEYRCDDKRFPRDRGYRKWITGLYWKWYRSTAQDPVEYDQTLGAFVNAGERRDNIDSHIEWASGCLAETYREEGR